MKPPRHFILGLVRDGDGHVRITRGERTYVRGGTKESHEHAADLVNEIDKECVKDPPQTEGERRMIVMEAARKLGFSKPPPKGDPPGR